MAAVLKRYLRRTYLDPSNPAGFTSIDQLYRQARKDGKKVTRREIKAFLQSVRAYTIHRPAPKKFPRRKVTTAGINDLLQIDLTDLQSLAHENDGYRYLFFCIDVFSKFLWVVPLKDKTQASTIAAMKKVLETLRDPPYNVEFDRGTEFGLRFKRFLEQHYITWYHPRNKVLKAETVERVQRTIKQRMFKYFTYNRHLRYLDVLPKIISAYNHAYHSTLQMAPIDVSKENEAKLWWHMYGDAFRRGKPQYKEGDTVRIRIEKGIFQKGYEPSFSEALYTVAKVLQTNPPTYRLKDYRGDLLDRLFYDKEMSLFTDKSGMYYIEKILDTQTVGHRKRYYVKWLGYDQSYNSWVWDRDIKHVYKA